MGKIKFLDGAETIGGTKILLEISGKRFFLDFGLNYKERDLYFEEYLNPRPSNGIGDLYFLGLLPKMKGIYRKDLVKFIRKEGVEELGTGEEMPKVNGVLLSHAHFDHSGYIAFLRSDIPIYTSNITVALMKAMEDVSITKFETSVFRFIRRPAVNSFKDPSYYGTHHAKIVKGETDIDGVSLTACPVDHSVPGAMGFIIKGEEGTIVYTGDLRLHGERRLDTEQFIQKARDAGPDILIIEGTNLRGSKKREFWTEKRVFEEAGRVINKTKGLVLVDFSIRNVYRFLTFFELAKLSGRKFAISLKDAYLLDAMKDIGMPVPSLSHPNIYFYLEKRKTGTYRDKDYSEKWIKRIMKKLDKSKIVTAKEIRENESAFMLVLRYFNFQQLIDLRPGDGSVYIHSTSEAFTEEQQIDERRMDHWLEHFGLYPRVHIHASGHAKKDDLFYIASEINPKIIVPVHTEHPEEYVEQFGNKVKIVKNGDEINF